MDEAKPTLLIVEDDLDIADMLNAYFRVQGYEVLTVNWGEDGVRAAHGNQPDLIILDIRLPDIDGFEVARRLRESRKTKTIPIIFLTDKRERSDRIKGLELQADDYITKPFDVQELRLRVRNAMLRAQQNSLTNPVTGLPEGSLVDETLDKALTRSRDVLLVTSLQNIEHFREVYGFVATDDLLRAVAIMLRDCLHESGGRDEFIGHLTPDDFVLICQPGSAGTLKERIRKRLEQSFEYFYSDQHREAGTFSGRPLAVQVGEIRLSTAGLHSLDGLKPNSPLIVANIVNITFIVPTYNEAENLPKLVSAVFALPMPELHLLIVDDNSPDGTGKIADELKEQTAGRVDVIHRAGKLGLGTAYIQGFQYALAHGADAIGQMDADFSHPIDKIPELAALLDQCDFAIGSRYVAGGSLDENWPLWRKGLSAFGNIYARLILGLAIRDVTGGFKLWKAETLRRMPLTRIRSNGYVFQVEMNYVATRLGFRAREIPIYFADRRWGQSKMNFRIQMEAAMRTWQLPGMYGDLKKIT